MFQQGVCPSKWHDQTPSAGVRTAVDMVFTSVYGRKQLYQRGVQYVCAYGWLLHIKYLHPRKVDALFSVSPFVTNHRACFDLPPSSIAARSEQVEIESSRRKKH